MPIERVFAAARLDRLPITSFHRKMMWLLGLCLLFRTRRSKHFLVRGASHSEPMASLDRDNRIHYFCHIRGNVYWINNGWLVFRPRWTKKGADFHNDLVRYLFTS